MAALGMILTFLLTLTCVGQAIGQCVFPESLTKKSRWETHIRRERIKTESFYKFNETKLEVQSYFSSSNKRLQSYSCERDMGDNRFVLKLDYNNGGGGGSNTQFQCMQFVVRSERIVQRYFSEIFTEIDTDDVCSEGMQRDDWPLIYPEMDGDYSQCPLEGGYTFDMQEYMTGDSLCQSMWLKPRLESECIKGEGLKIEFRHFDCLGDLSMKLIQKLSCLGSWEEGEYVFTILTNEDDMWPKLWMMRLPRQRETATMHTVLSKDIVADQSDFYGQDGLVPLENMYDMILTSEMYASLCED